MDPHWDRYGPVFKCSGGSNMLEDDRGVRFLLAALSLALGVTMVVWWRAAATCCYGRFRSAAMATALCFGLAAATGSCAIILTTR